MFQNDRKLDHKLPTRAYYELDWFQKEIKQILKPSWTFVGSRSKLPHHGDYLSTRIWSTPIIVRNERGQMKAFVNVCPHRHSCLRSLGYGNQAALTCQYHGWQYDKFGKLSYLPDGVSFRGFDASNVKLIALPMFELGDFLFVSLNQKPVSLLDELGEFGDELVSAFGCHKEVTQVVSEHAVNWKIIAENAIESYHVPMVHPTTFKTYRNPVFHDHTMTNTYTRYLDLQAIDANFPGRMLKLLSRLFLGKRQVGRFIQAHVFPTLLFYYHPLVSNLIILEPLGPTQTRQTMIACVPRNIRFPMVMRPLQHLFAKVFGHMGYKIIKEDAAIWQDIQRGLISSSFEGVLSAREERVHSFQSYIYEAMMKDIDSSYNE